MTVGGEKQVGADQHLDTHGEHEALARSVGHLVGEENDHHPTAHFVDLFLVQEAVVVAAAAASAAGVVVVVGSAAGAAARSVLVVGVRVRLDLFVVIAVRGREHRARTGRYGLLARRRAIRGGLGDVLVVKEDTEDADVRQREEEGDAREVRVLFHEEICAVSQVEIEKDKCIFHTAREERHGWLQCERCARPARLTWCEVCLDQTEESRRASFSSCRIWRGRTRCCCDFRCLPTTTTIEWRSTW